ncbi:protease subunit of ATP-dependent protease [Deinococcus peraridilitoris DSM 19664]|uniref:ATP-dependent Clp protease proteolytic subunit n=2 Tax=Deinococcus TaxID=1298 RepID=L0A2D4_DEIPD|nr:protease subunit of ATP-dependent protease [Deinococcus peraridilitoris DSM 19664]
MPGEGHARSVVLSGPLDHFCASDAAAHLLALDLDDPISPIEVLVGTPVGSVRAALALGDVLCEISAPTLTVGLGSLGLPGALVLVTGRRRRALEHCQIDLFFTSGSSWCDASTPVTVQANEAVLLRESVLLTLLKRTRLSQAELFRRLRVPQPMSAQEAWSSGLIDEVQRR